MLQLLRSPDYEPLEGLSLRQLTKKTLFLVALATAKTIGELQAVDRLVAFQGNDIHLSYLKDFRAKTESDANRLPRSFVVKALNDFVGDLPEELLLCPVRALKAYIARSERLLPSPRSLFRSPKRPKKAISKGAY